MARKSQLSPTQSATPARIQCAHDGCGRPAIVRIKTKTGGAVLCESHYEQHYSNLAFAALDKRGLERLGDESSEEWVERMRAFVRDKARAFGRRGFVPKRDEDAREAA